MNPSLAFWTGALINLLAIVALVAIGIRNIRRGRLAQHRRCMKTAAALSGGFLVAYPLKLLWLGREPLADWSAQSVLILRIHETFVLLMVVGGLVALILTRKMHRNRNQLSHLPDTPLASSGTLRIHRKAGWTAAIGAGLAFVTAAIVLVEMYERAVRH